MKNKICKLCGEPNDETSIWNSLAKKIGKGKFHSYCVSVYRLTSGWNYKGHGLRSGIIQGSGYISRLNRMKV